MWTVLWNTKTKDFLVMKWIPVLLNDSIVLSNWDFLVTFSWKTLKEIEDIKNRVTRINDNNEFYDKFPVSTEYWVILVSAEHMHSMQ